MERVCQNDICTGCGLCSSLCPQKCITMSAMGSLGHLYPKIQQDRCINCGLCQKKCPALNLHEQHSPITAFAAWSKDDIDYKSSTSGGAASILSQYVLSQKGVVYGCAMLPDIEVKHIRVDKCEDAQKLKGSKYVQSDISGILRPLKRDVDSGCLTLFIGTPCQVAAVRSLFKSQPENLLLVDLICHGVPSIETLKKHVKRVARYSHYDNVIFRKGTYIVVVVVDGRIVYSQPLGKPRYKDWYINTFFDGYTYRESCYKCPYACSQRISDITIGDFWGLGKDIPADALPTHPHGCSVIMPISEKGMNIVREVSSMMHMYERSVEEAVSGNDQLQAPTKQSLRKKFFRHLHPIIGNSAYYLVEIDKIAKYWGRKIKRKLKDL